MQHLIARPSDRLQQSTSKSSRYLGATIRSRTIARRRWMAPVIFWRWIWLAIGAAFIFSMFLYVEKMNRNATFEQIEKTITSLTIRAGFVVKDILLFGNHYVNDQMLLQILGFELGAPLIFIDLEAARKRVESLEWISAAELRRTPPNQLRLRVQEREPVALWQREKKLVMVDELGRPLEETPIKRFKNLPVIVGVGAPRAYGELRTLISLVSHARLELVAATWVGERRWNLKLANGLVVYLPEVGYQEAWANLILHMETEDLFSRDLTLVDLRQHGQMVVGVHPQAIWPDKVAADKSVPGSHTFHDEKTLNQLKSIDQNAEGYDA